MKSKVLILVVFLVILGSLIIPQDEKVIKSLESPAHFRAASWGMNVEQVKKVEKSELFDERKSRGLDMHTYKGDAGNLACLFTYYFAENQLVEGRYIFIEKHSNKNLYIEDFNEVNNNLVEKYGKSSSSNTIWRDDLYKDDYSDWGTAISVGHLVFELKWIFIESMITHRLSGDNYKITHVLDYKSELHKELVKKIEAKAKKKIW